MLPSYDQEKLTEACRLGKQIEKWGIGPLIRYACQHVTSDTAWDWTCEELMNFVYDKFVDELMADEKLFNAAKLNKGIEYE